MLANFDLQQSLHRKDDKQNRRDKYKKGLKKTLPKKVDSIRTPKL